MSFNIKNRYYDVCIKGTENYENLYTNKTFEYDILIDPNDLITYDLHGLLFAEITSNKNNYTIALVGSLYCNEENCALLKDNGLIVIMPQELYVIDLDKRELSKYIALDNYTGTFFEAYEFDNGYILYGELVIIKLNEDFEEEWTFWGDDIWVTNNGNSAIEIIDDSLHLEDFNGDRYIVDKYGNGIRVDDY